MAIKDPSTPATKIAKKIKLLIYGDYGTGKTLAALTFPKPVVIDMEGGLDLYAGREGVPSFGILQTKSLQDVYDMIAFLQEDKGKKYETLIIDPITVLYDVQKEAAVQALVKAGKKDELTYRDWGKISARMTALYNALTNLPVHVVIVARESLLYANDTANLKVTGVKPDADKKIGYMFDFVVHTRKKQPAEVIKSRGIGLGDEIKDLSWNTFAKAAGLFVDGSQAKVMDDDAAAQRDSAAFADAVPDMLRQSDEVRFPRFLKWAEDTHKMTETDVMRALYTINNATFKQAAAGDAKAAVEKWVSRQDVTRGDDTPPVPDEYTMRTQGRTA